jgi:multiple sugar transport system permease protein
MSTTETLVSPPRNREKRNGRQGRPIQGHVWRSRITLVLVYVFLAAAAATWVLPILYAFGTSFKSPADFATAGFQLLPTTWVLDNYVSLIGDAANFPVIQWFLNSLLIATSHAALMVVVVSLAAYGYSRVKFPGRDTLFLIILAVSLFPNVVNLIPSYKVVQTLGWINNPLAMIIPGLGAVAFIFLVRSFMAGIPRELDEAARLDGANEWTVFSRVILPTIRPVLIVVFLFAFTGSWNDFLWPLIVFNDVDRFPITAGLLLLQNLFGNFTMTGQLMASAILAMIPTTLLFIFAQRYFVRSLALTSGLKG